MSSIEYRTDGYAYTILQKTAGGWGIKEIDAHVLFIDGKKCCVACNTAIDSNTGSDITCCDACEIPMHYGCGIATEVVKERGSTGLVDHLMCLDCSEID